MVFLHPEITEDSLSSNLFVTLTVSFNSLLLDFIFFLKNSLLLILDLPDLFIFMTVDSLEDIPSIGQLLLS